MSQHIETSKADGVLTIRLNRPDKKNALTREMYRQMTAGFATAASDETVGCILITGTPGAFCAGNDLADFMEIARGGGLPNEVRDFLHALAKAELPVFAAVDGLAIGIGTTMLFHCDMVLATPRSEFKTPFVDLGLTPEAASSLIAPRLMGAQRAFQMLAMGRPFDAAFARECGFVTEIVADDVEGSGFRAAKALAAKPREAVRLTKALIRGDRSDVLSCIDDEIEIFARRLVSSEARQAFEAFFSRKG
ncbi:crotonase/enoyl-CoA hydratase family protein [Fulvimarina sp. 2208YS6-2-32]|uniref:Crotonase/enoyl-CoA hydratase family protein n=1 Tax=Fulvimarina uroteuthidis TaxID=3098149 RepID=A0ABU5HXA8_9HYPH|nr:crotonase/enoyl-CoA hydratase family protein [Fulvimarina sp. 2208YS6-2-32]MDY8107606.1 crotonase/enoyl-CoA hydratase family protein [Fulvimarina sp. 2208YS6-2-32]